MIGDVAGGFEFLPAAAGLAGGEANGVEKFIGGDMRGAGAGDEPAMTGQMAKAVFSQARVGVDGAGAFAFAFGQGRRVEDDEAKMPFLICRQPLEGVGLDAFVPAMRDVGIGLVQLKIPAGGGQGVLADIEVGDGLGAAARGVEGKAAGKTEGVEHIQSLRELANLTTVLALVQKKPGFLALQDFGFELDSIFEKHHGRG